MAERSKNPAVGNAIAVSIGAIVGALSRYYCSAIAQALLGKSAAYYGTGFVNIIGCFIIAFFLTLNAERFQRLPARLRLVVVTGFCGAYTTFSTYQLEMMQLLETGNGILALGYGLGSAIAGMVAVLLGIGAARLGYR